MIDNIQQMTKLTGDAAKRHEKFNQFYVDLASDRVGGETLSCSDDFFAGMENLLKPGRGIFIEDKYTDRGKWMDGWESRRSYGREKENGEPHQLDWCIIRLGISGVIKGLDIDTNYFRGNAPQFVSVEACASEQQPDENTKWLPLLKKSPVAVHSQNLFEIDELEIDESELNMSEIDKQRPWTHIRLNMFPDGGIARLRVYGEAKVNWKHFVDGELIDLASIKNGAKALLVSDMFFSDKNNLLMPGRGKDMGDGWETKRRRDPGPDWSIVKLADQGNISKVIIDTCHFKGNFPDRFMLEGLCSESDDFIDSDKPQKWQVIIPQTKLYAHREHSFIEEILIDNAQYFTHVRLSIFPDGGVSRMRVFGSRKKS